MNNVHIEEVTGLNIAVTSKQEILAQCRKIVMEQGIEAVNMRFVAGACGAAVGSIYNYFPSKADLMAAAVADVWEDIFHMPDEIPMFLKFTDCLEWLYESIKSGSVKYPGFFTLHSVSFAAEDKRQGRQLMEEHFGHIRRKLTQVLENDSQVRKNAFEGALPKEEFVEMIFTLLISMLLQGKEDCGPLLEMAGRCIY